MFEVGTKVRLRSWVTVGDLTMFGISFSEAKVFVEGRIVGEVCPKDSGLLRPLSVVSFPTTERRWVFKDEWLEVVESYGSSSSSPATMKDVLDGDMSDSDKVLAIRKLIGWS